MSNMITISSGFQSSVNIEYDMNNDEKLKHYIPTRSAMKLLEDILLSTNPDATDRARILIGAYGKGKSHIVLMILSILMQKDLALFEKMEPVVKNSYPNLYQLILNYKKSGKKILPVIISGNGVSISQSFMFALERTLNEYELDDIMPETNYQAAVETINRWKNEFPETHKKFEKMIDGRAEDFNSRLSDYDNSAYEQFENIYPKLTSGSMFNPFMGMDIVSLYDAVVKSLKTRGYDGIYVIYDEFSKYLEDKIAGTTKGDTKALQDFAEKCARSGSNQLHIMLISHKEIASYIGKADKSVVDGWRGVSERFHHVYLNNNFTQTYEIIAAAIEKDNEKWNQFKIDHDKDFESLFKRYETHPIFSDSSKEDIERVIHECYPLHPVTTFILPRLSERVAQNERTLFTFISSAGHSTLSSWLKEQDEAEFHLATPDLVYDYFEPLLRQEIYSGSLHKMYVLTASVLRGINDGSLEAKIIKAISLIYILEQFEKLQPTVDELVGIFSQYAPNDVKKAIDNLIDKEYVIYLKRSNNYLRLKETSGIDIQTEIDKKLAEMNGAVSMKETLNESNVDNYMYPSRYNDEKEMTRYFSFRFIDEDEVNKDTNWKIKSETIHSDGVVYAIIPRATSHIKNIEQLILKSSAGCNRCVFVIPKKTTKMENIVAEYKAVCSLRENAADPVIFADYEVVYEDLHDVLTKYISEFTHPEYEKCSYYCNGKRCTVQRKASLTELMSQMCYEMYGKAPVINNEMLNLEEPSGIAVTSRGKIVSALLRSDIEEHLGFTGNGQEVSLMRSTLELTNVLISDGTSARLDLEPKDVNMAYMFSVIIDFIKAARKNGRANFSDLYKQLITDELGIGMRKGLIPIYLAAVFHQYRKEIVLFDEDIQVPLNNETLMQINADPSDYRLAYLDWDDEREGYISALEAAFSDTISQSDNSINSYDYIAIAMRKWYLSLPKYSKNLGDRKEKMFLKELKENTGSYEMLFKHIPVIFGSNVVDKKLAGQVNKVKTYYDEALDSLIKDTIERTKSVFSTQGDSKVFAKMSLYSVIKDWIESLSEGIFEQLFPDGTDKCLLLFKNATNDDKATVEALGKIATDLRIDDWDSDVVNDYYSRLETYKHTAEKFETDAIAVNSSNGTLSNYELVYTDVDGKAVTRRFDKVEGSKRGQLLYNSIVNQINAMGQSISEQEKRQVLMDILKEIC